MDVDVVVISMVHVCVFSTDLSALHREFLPKDMLLGLGMEIEGGP